MTIKSHIKEYSVNISTDFNEIKSIKTDKNIFFVIDKTLYELYHDMLFTNIPSDQLFLLDAREENKTIETALEICEIMTNIPAKRNSMLVSFGGGIVQDVSGFVANILYRGIRWSFYPTTLLAACDSCIGGKTSLNYKNYKNLLGTFFPPDEINICTAFFNTLSEKDFKSGLGEVVKFNIMLGEQGIHNMEQSIELLLARNSIQIMKFVNSSLAYKKEFIEADEFDRGIRIHLNFAHTFGHAFETMSHYEIPHGTAVAMGMIVANRISLKRGWLKEETVLRIEKILWKIIHIDQKHITVNIDKIIQAIHKDKKQTGTELTAVLMKNNMVLQIVHDVKYKEIEEAIVYLFSQLQS